MGTRFAGDLDLRRITVVHVVLANREYTLQPTEQQSFAVCRERSHPTFALFLSPPAGLSFRRPVFSFPDNKWTLTSRLQCDTTERES